METSERLRLLESNLEDLLHDAQSAVANTDALAYLKNGLRARHYILRHCREYLERTCFVKMETPLSPDVATEAALHLNGYYLNVRGTLDNLAWMLQFHFGVLPGVTENSGKNRMKIHLFGASFLEALREAAPKLACYVSSMKEWGLDLAALRDPAAHRIPLYVPPGVLTSQEQVDEFRRLDALSGAPEEQLGGKRRIEIMMEAQRTASFYPVFCVTSSAGIKVYGIKNQLLRDHRQYLHLIRKVLERVSGHCPTTRWRRRR